MSASTAPLPAPAEGRDALSVLHSVFGLPGFRGAQGEIIRHVTGGGNCLVLMPTGGGKSLCYQIAVAAARRLRHRGLAADRADAGSGRRPDRQRRQRRGAEFVAVVLAGSLRDRAALDRQGDLDLLYVAPERLW